MATARGRYAPDNPKVERCLFLRRRLIPTKPNCKQMARQLGSGTTFGVHTKLP